MTEKRFTYEKSEQLSKKILQLEEDLLYYKSKCASLEEGLFRQDREVSRLEKENEQLKQQLRHLEYRFTEYRIKNYKQSNRRVLDLIDKKIKEVDTIGAEVLKDLRRELME